MLGNVLMDYGKQYVHTAWLHASKYALLCGQAVVVRSYKGRVGYKGRVYCTMHMYSTSQICVQVTSLRL